MSYFSLKKPVWVVNALFVLVFLGVIALPLDGYFKKVFVDFAEMMPAWCAGLLAIQYGRRCAATRPTGFLGWIFLGIGGFSYGIGQATWTYYELIGKRETPFPSWADAGFLTAQFFLILSVFVLFGSMAPVGRLRSLLDSAIAVSSVAILSWYLLISNLWSQSATSMLAKVIGVAYPLSDIAAFYGAVVLLAGTSTMRQVRRSILLLIGGILFLTAADTGFTYYTMNEVFRSGCWVDAGWAFGWLMNAYAIRLQIVQAAGQTEENDVTAPRFAKALANSPAMALLRLLVPYLVAAVTGASVALHGYRAHGTVSASVLGWIAALTVLVIVRQVITLVENQQLTQQVASLLEFTKSLNDSLDIQEVLSITTGALRRLIPVDGVLVWVQPGEADSRHRRRADDGNRPPLPPGCVQWGLDDDLPWVRSLIGKAPAAISNTHPLTPLAASTATRDKISLTIPLLHHSEAVGAITLVRRARPFLSAEYHLLESLAAEISTVVANAISYQDAVAAADRDPVTALFNHRAIHQRLQTECEKASRKGSGLAVIMMDMNNFKFFNDTYGHPAGDQVIQMVATVLQEVCRSTDILGRYGGDEFVAILPETNGDGGVRVAERLRARFAQEGYRAVDGKVIPVTLSFGIASFPEDTEHRHELIALADANLYKAKLTKEKVGLTSEARRRERELRGDESYAFLEGLVVAVDNKDSYTRRHSEDVTEYALWIAAEMKLADDCLQTLRIGGLLHDVGKIGVPDHILRKPGALSADEFELVRRHPELGAGIVAGIPGMQSIVSIVRSHHERWDGSGYPDRLAGEAIPLLARIVAVADAFSAMTTARPYRRAMPAEQALSIIADNSATQFDPQIAEAFGQAFAKHQAAHSHRAHLYAA